MTREISISASNVRSEMFRSARLHNIYTCFLPLLFQRSLFSQRGAIHARKKFTRTLGGGGTRVAVFKMGSAQNKILQYTDEDRLRRAVLNETNTSRCTRSFNI